MAHESYLNLMNLSLDGMLSLEEDRELHDHIAGCAACASTYSRMQALESMLQTPLFITPPPNFGAAVMARIARGDADKFSRLWLQALLILIIVLSILAVSVPVVGITLGLHRQILEYPAVSNVMTNVSQMSTQFGDMSRAGLSGIFAPLSLTMTDPLMLALVILALVAVSTYIGLREAMRTSPVGEIATQQA